MNELIQYLVSMGIAPQRALQLAIKLITPAAQNEAPPDKSPYQAAGDRYNQAGPTPRRAPAVYHRPPDPTYEFDGTTMREVPTGPIHTYQLGINGGYEHAGTYGPGQNAALPTAAPGEYDPYMEGAPVMLLPPMRKGPK